MTVGSSLLTIIISNIRHYYKNMILCNLLATFSKADNHSIELQDDYIKLVLYLLYTTDLL